MKNIAAVNMTNITLVFKRMLSNKMVRITKSARDKINGNNIGKWFYILSVNCNNTVNLCSDNHTILENEPIESIYF